MKKGLNILSINEDVNREDMPQEARMMLDMIDLVLNNTVRICEEKEINVSVLPSIYLHAFNKIMPLLIQSLIESDGKKMAQTHLNMLGSIIEFSFNVETYND